MIRIFTSIFVATIFICSSAQADKPDGNLRKEGNKVLVKESACLKFGGHVSDKDKRYFVCDGGKYRGMIIDPEDDFAGDPNIRKEGNKTLVKESACLRFGGRVSDDDKRYFVCSAGKYRGMIIDPDDQTEGDEEEIGQP